MMKLVILVLVMCGFAATSAAAKDDECFHQKANKRPACEKNRAKQAVAKENAFYQRVVASSANLPDTKPFPLSKIKVALADSEKHWRLYAQSECAMAGLDQTTGSYFGDACTADFYEDRRASLERMRDDWNDRAAAHQ